MSTNLVEFLSVATLVGGVTTAISMFRYVIIIFERKGEEETRRRQPEWDALAAKYSQESK